METKTRGTRRGECGSASERRVAALETAVLELRAMVGTAPNLAEDKPGSGIAKQVAELVTKDRSPRLATYVTAVFTGLVLVAQGVQLLKSLGVLK